MFAVVDANNFFASCERVFRPDLTNRPVVVLSSNDGCVVARSQEVRDMGIAMGVPYFQIKNQLTEANVAVFSSNFSLYADMSQRMQTIIADYSPDTEVYSIDESFVELKGMTEVDIDHWATGLRHRIWQWLGLPVSIGVAQTKTLAKLASHEAKHTTGVSVLQGQALQEALARTEVDEVWGIGRRLAPRLRNMGIKTALDLSQVDYKYAGQIMGKKGQQTVRELNEQVCIPLAHYTKPPQSIMVSRSFGGKVNDYSELETALASFVMRAAAKLRHHSLNASALGLYLRHESSGEVGSINAYGQLSYPTADSAVLVGAALDLLQANFNENNYYKKAGVILFDFTSTDQRQMKLFGQAGDTSRRISLMQSIDQLNHRFGSDTVHLASEDVSKHTWQPRSERRSPDYTRSWNDLPLVN